MTAGLTIEPMQGRHLAAVEAIDALAYSRPWSTATWRTELAADDRRHLVARRGDRVVGHAGMLRILDDAHITTVAVHPDEEGRGIGTRLVALLLDEARRWGIEAATLEVRAAHHRTQRMYARLGFNPAGVRKGYYSHPPDDAIVMWLPEFASPAAAQRILGVLAETGDIASKQEETTA
jgi:ribosomal-protein-alanine N-acetyltransferase